MQYLNVNPASQIWRYIALTYKCKVMLSLCMTLNHRGAWRYSLNDLLPRKEVRVLVSFTLQPL